MSSVASGESAATPKNNNRVSEEDTIKFLISCIKHSEYGKVRLHHAAT